MTVDQISLEDYLAQGGKLTSPGNVPPRYRAELLRLMATFVDSELAGAAGFADIINQGPGIKERIAAARIVLEKTDHADRVLKIMGEFGANTERYATHHPWAARLERDADIGAVRSEHDMRLAVFNYPLNGWTDAVVMNLLMGLAVNVQLAEFSKGSYQPLAQAFQAIAPIEAHHTELAEEGLAHLLEDQDQRTAVQESLAYWWPRVASSFGSATSDRIDALRRWGLRQASNAELCASWEQTAKDALSRLGLSQTQ